MKTTILKLRTYRTAKRSGVSQKLCSYTHSVDETQWSLPQALQLHTQRRRNAVESARFLSYNKHGVSRLL